MKKALVFALLSALVLVLSSCSEEVLAKGTITGKVTNSNIAVNGAYVMLMEEGQLITGEQPLSNGSITGSDGKYSIYLVTPNTYYYVVAVQDVDGDTQYTPGVDKVGYHGNLSGFTWVPTSVSVGSGETLTDINITSLIIMPAK